MKNANKLLSEGGFRHQWVMQGGACVAMLSICVRLTEYRVKYERFQEMRG